MEDYRSYGVMIVGELSHAATGDLFIEAQKELQNIGTIAPIIILESAHNKHQAASIALASVLQEKSTAQALVEDPHVLILFPDNTETLKRVHIELVQKHFHYKTTENTGRIVVIPDATQLSVIVQNALLKTAEELHLPHHIIFGVQHADQLLPTIQSRSQVITVAVEDEDSPDHIIEFWRTFFAGNSSERKRLIDAQFSKKTKKGQEQREQLEAYIVTLQKMHLVKDAEIIKKIEYFRKICHTVNSQMILDSFLFL